MILQSNGVLASDIIFGYFYVRFEDDCPAGFFNNTCLYDIRLIGTKVMSVYLNKIFLLIFVATFGTVQHHHSVHPYLLPYILISIVALYLCLGALELQSPTLWLP